ncbi:MAG: FkbM family methyltransferase [Cyclobacteriaceae bacterium]|nr:FkbM family methyltransferase [Cyclobacteriaceae bacterium]
MTFKKLARRVLQAIPMKKKVFTLVRYFSPPEYLYRHLYFNGWFKVHTNQRSFVMYHYGYQLENQVFWKGLEGWERASMRLWMALSAKSGIIFDIGANTGIFSLVAKAVNPPAEVYSFEPVERVYRKLKRNIEVNQFNVVAEQLGVSNRTGSATIYDVPEDHVYSVTINKNLNAEGRPVIPTTIQVTTLDHYVRARNLGAVNLMKIDVETHEPEVLEGALEMIRKSRPAILVEVLTSEVADRLMVLFRDLKYVYFSVNELNGPQLTTVIAPHQHQNYLLYPGDPQDVIALWNEKTTH